MRIPVCLQEQNSLPGITNRLLARLARRVYIAFEESRGYLPAAKTLLTGNPVRKAIVALREASDPPRPERPFTVLIAGGSQGARSINTAVIGMLPYIEDPRSLDLIHQSGRDDLARVRRAYRDKGLPARVAAFFDDMDRQYAQADLVVCRAGATTVAELTCMGKPAIFIPFPHAADNHQEINARALVKSDAAEIILERELDGRLLWDHIRRLRDDPERRSVMAERARALGRPDADAVIVADIVQHCLPEGARRQAIE
jgi:UDP-N-acetylglucosamine--N-acetylmuramyl-(pentapeptide) pyrophosphoryl-undecaprenol N-acetylglucosamine transferase